MTQRMFTLLIFITAVTVLFVRAVDAQHILPTNGTAPVSVESGLPLGLEHPSFRARLWLPKSVSPIGEHLGVEKQFEETSYYLKDTDFITTAIGWAVGEPHWNQATKSYTGTILQTADSGETWITQTVPTSEILRGVDFVSLMKGWVVGADGTLLHTEDGGIHWTPQSIATTDELRGVVFADENTGWVTSVQYGAWGDPDNWKASIWQTTNGGVTWITQTIPISASILNRIDFVDAQHGWTVGVKYLGNDTSGDSIHRAVVYHTADGGQTWQEQRLGLEDYRITLTGVDCVDAQNGWVVGFHHVFAAHEGVIFHTTDGGVTWERQAPYKNFWDVQFIDQNRGYAVGFDYIGAAGSPVYRTLDGGAHWYRMDMSHNDLEGLYGVIVKENLVLALGDYSYVVRETDPWAPCGEDCTSLFTQKYVSTHYTLRDVFFVDENTGWAVGSRSFVPQIWGQVILQTRDGGQTWSEQYTDPPSSFDTLFDYLSLRSVFFVDAQHGWAVGDSKMVYGSGWEYHNALLYTSDGGTHWIEQGRELYPKEWYIGEIEIQLLDVQFLDSLNGWALASNPCANNSNACLAHTTDGGTTWSWVNTSLAGSDLAFGGRLFFNDASRGWAVGGLENVYHTADGGTSWNRQDPPTASSRLHDVAFVNNQEGWIAGEAFYHTTNGGASWAAVEMNLSGDLNAVQFIDDQHGFTAGDGGNILYTVNGGQSWLRVPNTVSPISLNGLHFRTSQKGWLVGEYGTILATVSLPYWALYLPIVTH